MVGLLPLVLEGAVLRRRGKVLLGPLDWRLEGAGITALIGPNGSGKTSLLRLMHGLDQPREGRVVWGLPPAEARRRQAYVFQTPILLRRSVARNLAFPLELAGVARSLRDARVADWLARVGLSGRADLPAQRLSGGERQKLALARALITGPEVLFLDEPCASLDGASTREIEALIRAAAAGGTRIVIATHDMGQARRLADEVLFLMRGRVHETGPAQRLHTPQTSEMTAFLKGDILE